MTDDEIRQLNQAYLSLILMLLERVSVLEKLVLWSNLANPQLHSIAQKMAGVELAEIRKRIEDPDRKALEELLQRFEGTPQ